MALSFISIKSEQISKMCSMVNLLSHAIHVGGFSLFSKKEGQEIVLSVVLLLLLLLLLLS